MPTDRDIAAFRRNAKRNRTPRILSASYNESELELTLTFDRPMDAVPATPEAPFVIRLFDGSGGHVLESTGGAWTAERTFVADMNEVDSYSGPTFVRYLSGDFRAKSRYFMDNGERCDRVEIV